MPEPQLVPCPRCSKGVGSTQHVARQKDKRDKGDLSLYQYAVWAFRFCRLCHAELSIPLGLAVEYRLMDLTPYSEGLLEIRARHGFKHHKHHVA